MLHYDGAMFTNNDTVFKALEIDDVIFEEFIEKLYYPSPISSM